MFKTTSNKAFIYSPCIVFQLVCFDDDVNNTSRARTEQGWKGV